METNNLIYRTNKVVGKEHIFVTIRLNDECKNGHQDFSITGDIYEYNKPKTVKYLLSGGCIHEDILKHFPKFKIFVDLHLCDINGIPMHAISNGFYHLKTSPMIKEKFCSYYRITEIEYDILLKSETKEVYAYYLNKLGIFERWNEQAKEAIKLLEELTGDTIINDSKRSQMDLILTHKRINEIDEEFKTDFYSDENILLREQNKIKEENEAKLLKIKEERKNKIGAINLEYDCLEWLHNYGLSLNNFIFYHHSKEAHFNWKGYEKKITEEQFKQLQKDWKFEGVKLTVKEF